MRQVECRTCLEKRLVDCREMDWRVVVQIDSVKARCHIE